MARRILLPVVAALIVLSVASPATAAWNARAAHRPDPVLLVHGFRGSGAGWHSFAAELLSHGYRASEIDAINYDSAASNVDTARRLALEVAALRARTGASRIDIVSHSMGAISSRYYLERLGGESQVDAWVSLAGVNEGTVWAYGCYMLTPCREMVPSSSVLRGLNEGFRAGTQTRFGAWWSPCDEAVIPHANAELPGAHNVETACLDHSALKDDPRVVSQVMRFLSGRSAA